MVQASTLPNWYFCNRAYDLTKLRRAGLPIPQVTLSEGLRKLLGLL